MLASFVSLAAIFHRRCLAHGISNRRLQGPLWTLYASSGLILIRTVYRIVEYFSVAELKFNKPGFDPMSMSPIIRYEWFFYVFEGAVMISNCLLFNVRHPRRYLPLSNKIYLARDGQTEVEGPGFTDSRPLLLTMVDPFNILGLLTGRKGQGGNKFWESDGRSVGPEGTDATQQA